MGAWKYNIYLSCLCTRNKSGISKHPCIILHLFFSNIYGINANCSLPTSIIYTLRLTVRVQVLKLFNSFFNFHASIGKKGKILPSRKEEHYKSSEIFEFYCGRDVAIDHRKTHIPHCIQKPKVP
jgi:hypothetical protein